VISIGNLTVGGTGKSPATVMIARILASEGLRPVILSRGYRRDGGGTVVVSDGSSLLVTASRGGDEPVMMAEELPGVPIYVDAIRRRAAEAALARHPDAVFLLDDGFSHRGLARDLDVVVIDASSPFGNGLLLPGGILREPKEALSRAGCVILNRAGLLDPEALRRLTGEVAGLAGGAPIFAADYRPAGLVPVSGGPVPRARDGLRVLSFAGIVNHRHFEATLARLGLRIVDHVPFPDHHRYGSGDLKRLAFQAAIEGAELMVTTAKDAVKINPAWTGGFPLARVDIAMEVADTTGFREIILRGALRG
jgi:tetraacyldisaccharide 4'-kinase